MACKIVTLDGDGWDDGSAALAEGFAHEVAARGNPKAGYPKFWQKKKCLRWGSNPRP